MYATQVGIAPPTFVFFTNVATTFHFSYERFLVNRLRERLRVRGVADPDRGAGPGAPPVMARLARVLVYCEEASWLRRARDSGSGAVQGGGGLRDRGRAVLRAAVVGAGVSLDWHVAIAGRPAGLPAGGRRAGPADQGARVRGGPDAGGSAAQARGRRDAGRSGGAGPGGRHRGPGEARRDSERASRAARHARRRAAEEGGRRGRPRCSRRCSSSREATARLSRRRVLRSGVRRRSRPSRRAGRSSWSSGCSAAW